MTAYLYTAICTVSQLRPNRSARGPGEIFETWDGCSMAVMLADNSEVARRVFEEGLYRHSEGEHPPRVEVKKIAAAQLVDQLITESGSEPLDWPALVQRNRLQVEAGQPDEFEQGYWVDVETVVRLGNLSSNIEELQRNVPEDIRSGLNWSVEKQFLFVLSVFAPRRRPAEFADAANSMPIEDLETNVTAGNELQLLLETYPQGADKDAAAVIQARNSVVAAWLWRRFAADTPLAANRIRIDPWCEISGLEMQQ